MRFKRKNAMNSRMPFVNAFQKTVLALLLSLSAALGLSGCDDGLNIQVSEQQIESQMARFFPYHKETLMGQLKLDLQQPDLILKDNSERAELLLQTKISAAGIEWPGQMRLSFGVDYAPETGIFYLVEPRLEDLAMNGIPQQLSSSVIQNLVPLVQQYLTRVPVYTLKPQTGDAQNMARQTLKKLAIKDRNLIVTLGWVKQP